MHTINTQRKCMGEKSDDAHTAIFCSLIFCLCVRMQNDRFCIFLHPGEQEMIKDKKPRFLLTNITQKARSLLMSVTRTSKRLLITKHKTNWQLDTVNRFCVNSAHIGSVVYYNTTPPPLFQFACCPSNTLLNADKRTSCRASQKTRRCR